MKKYGMNLLICALLLASLFLSACSVKTEIELPELLEPVGVNIDTEVVTRGDLVRMDYYEGSLQPDVSELYFEVDGVLNTLYVYPGQYVEEGDVIMELEQDAALQQIDSLQEQIDYLKTKGEYDDQIADLDINYLQIEYIEIAQANGEASQQAQLKALEIEEAELKKKQTVENREKSINDMEADLQNLQNKVSQQKLVAPHAGHVFFYDNVAAGSFVQANRTVCYLTDEENLTFVINKFMEEAALKNHESYGWLNGQAVELERIPVSDDERVAILMGQAAAKTRFYVKGSDELLSQLKPGMYGVFCLENVRVEDALLIPMNALNSDADGSYVYVVDGDRREKRYIVTRQNNGSQAVVLSGLEEGEVIYIAE